MTTQTHDTAAPARPAVDPITIEIVQGTVESARKEMELQVERTARSVIIRERRDYRAAVFDRHGRNVSSASAAAHVEPILAYYAIEDVHEGDVFIWNDPFKSAGGLTHLPDICITQPVFYGGELSGYVQVYGHVLDIGGIVPGSIAIGASEIFQEGLIIPPVKLYDQGEVVEPLYRLIVNNSRFPEDLRGDLDAEIMACRVGVRRFQGLLDLYGPETVDAAFEEILEACARAIREHVLPLIPEGRYEFEDFVEINGAAPLEKRKFIRLRVAMYREGPGSNGDGSAAPGPRPHASGPDEKLIFDFTGTDAQSLASINIAGNERYYVKYLVSIFRTIVPDVIFNAGALRVVECRLGKRTVLSAEFPASCSYRALTLFRIPDLCMGALAKALGGRGAGAADTRSVYRYNGVAEGKPFLLHDGIGGGAGGRPVGDGADAINGNVAGVGIPVEYIEAFYPVRIERHTLAADSGGPGKRRGGMGIAKNCRLLAPGSLLVFDDRQALQPPGIGGGLAGDGTYYVLNPGAPDEQILDYKATNVKIKAGDLLQVRTPGGGGWGDPLERETDLVLRDVVEGLVSLEAARERYAVVITQGTGAGGQGAANGGGTDAGKHGSLEVDESATAALRAERRAARGPLPMVERGDRFRKRPAAGDISLTTSDTQPPVTFQ